MENKPFYQKSNAFFSKKGLQCIAASISMIFIIFIGVLPGFFYYPLLLLTVPLIICPGFLGLHLIVNALEWKHPLPGPLALVGVPAYYGSKYRGCYRVIFGTLKSLLGFLGGLFLTAFIYAPIALNVDPEFSSLMEQFTKISLTGDVAAVQTILNSQSMIRYVVTVLSVATFVHLVIFCWHLSIHTQNVIFRLYMARSGDGGSLNSIFLGSFRVFGREMKRNLRGVSWICFGLITLGYAAGIAVGYFIKQSVTMFMPLSGVIGALSFLSFFIPYFDRYSNLVGYYYSFRLREYSINQAEQEFESFRAMRGLSDEETKMFQDAVKKAKEELETIRQTFDPWDYPADRA